MQRIITHGSCLAPQFIDSHGRQMSKQVFHTHTHSAVNSKKRERLASYRLKDKSAKQTKPEREC